MACVKNMNGEQKRRHLMTNLVRKVSAILEQQEVLQKALTQFNHDLCPPNSSESHEIFDKEEMLRQIMRIGEAEKDKVRKSLHLIQKINDSHFREKLKIGKMARHQLMSLLCEQAACLPLYVTPPFESPPRLVGAIAASNKMKLLVGDFCAAFISDNWILAEITDVIQRNEYEMRDIDDETQSKICVMRRSLIPLPKWRADPKRDTHALFPKDAWVLALYPQTTCFYKGVIAEVPSEAPDPYQISFDDPTYEGGLSPKLPVPQMFVVAFREGDQKVVKKKKYIKKAERISKELDMSRRKEGSRMSEDKELVEGMWKDEVEGEDLQDSLEGLRKADFSDIEEEEELQTKDRRKETQKKIVKKDLCLDAVEVFCK